MDGSQRDQRLARTALRDHHGCPRLLPAFGHSHNRDRLCRERRSQQSFNPRGNCIVELVEGWILLENALSQKRRVTSHVIVDCGQFWHGSPLEEVEGRHKHEKKNEEEAQRSTMR